MRSKFATLNTTKNWWIGQTPVTRSNSGSTPTTPDPGGETPTADNVVITCDSVSYTCDNVSV